MVLFRIGVYVMLLASSVSLLGWQSTGSNATSANPSATRDTPAANAWMFVPMQNASDDIPPFLRTERHLFWDKGIGAHEALTKVGVGSAIACDWAANTPEIPKGTNRAIVTAKFVSYHGFLSASERSIYTEVKLQVDKVFQVEAGHAEPGQNITLSLPGGAAIASGKVIRYLEQPRKLFIQPGKRYLFVLTYEPTLRSYLLGDDWDLSDGIVRLNSDRAQFVKQLGHASLDGLTEAEMEPVLYRILSAELP